MLMSGQQQYYLNDSINSEVKSFEWKLNQSAQLNVIRLWVKSAHPGKRGNVVSCI